MTKHPLSRLKDVLRIKRVMLDAGFERTLRECASLWETLSDLMHEDWLPLPRTDAELLYLLLTGEYKDFVDCRT